MVVAQWWWWCRNGVVMTAVIRVASVNVVGLLYFSLFLVGVVVLLVLGEGW